MRRLLISLTLALAACEQPAPPEPLRAPSAPIAPSPWFICDALNMPALLVFTRDGGVVRVAQYDKPSGALAQRSEYQLGPEQGAAGSVYVTLLQNGAEAGAIRRLSTGALETPTAAYTPPFVAVRLGQSEAQCRWMPRTRVFAITGKRSIVLHEDGDGDLIYTAYDYADAATARTVELSNNARTSTFSAEVRGGDETVGADGESYTFSVGPIAYNVTVERNGEGALQVTGAPAPQPAEPFLAVQRGAGAE
jgi:hypothetical protein